MSEEPTFPKEAAVGDEAAEQQPKAISTSARDNAGEGDPKRKKYVKTGVAVGIGSAAIVAALLYANRGKKDGNRNND